MDLFAASRLEEEGLKIFFVLVVAFVLILPAGAFAQVNATVGGIVSDASGALIPGVEVTAKNNATGIVTTRLTNEAGSMAVRLALNRGRRSRSSTHHQLTWTLPVLPQIPTSCRCPRVVRNRTIPSH
jgi:hypothetical protein